ncbi:MAG: YraN family protein [Pyrinomonadaceae bacterium]
MDDIISITEVQKVQRPSLGETGERLAAEHLLANGYRMVVTNFKVPIGRNSKGVAVTGEIDIIALDGASLCFVEVKTRRSDEFAAIESAVDLQKQRQITRTAKVYRRLFNVWDMPHRYDVVTVLMPRHEEPSVELLKDFWNESRFKKRTWNVAYWQESA